MILKDQITIIFSLDQNSSLMLKIDTAILEIPIIKFLKTQVLIDKIDFI